MRFLTIFSLLLFGCAGSALDRHVSSAAMVRVGLNGAADALEIVCDPENVGSPEAARRCLRAVEGHDTARAAWLVWAEALIAADGDRDLLQMALNMAGPMIESYNQLAEFLEVMGVTIPPLPTLVGAEQ